MEVLWLDRGSTWMDPIPAYLTDDTLYADSKEANQMKKRSTGSSSMTGFYVRGLSPGLFCIT